MAITLKMKYLLVFGANVVVVSVTAVMDRVLNKSRDDGWGEIYTAPGTSSSVAV